MRLNDAGFKIFQNCHHVLIQNISKCQKVSHDVIQLSFPHVLLTISKTSVAHSLSDMCNSTDAIASNYATSTSLQNYHL